MLGAGRRQSKNSERRGRCLALNTTGFYVRPRAIIGPSEPGGLGIVLGAEPAIRCCQRGITAAPLQVIDADISGEAGAGGKLSLDATPRRHRRLVRKQHRADLAILVSPARRAQQGAVLSPAAELMRGDKAAFPKPP